MMLSRLRFAMNCIIVVLRAPFTSRINPRHPTSSQGDPADCMYLISQGLVELYGAQHTPLLVLGPGSHFGEEAVIKVCYGLCVHGKSVITYTVQNIHKTIYKPRL